MRNGWRLVAWINAEDPESLQAGLAAVGEAAGLVGPAAADAGLAVRHWLEADGEPCLIVIDNRHRRRRAAAVSAFPSGGVARVVITE